MSRKNKKKPNKRARKQDQWKRENEQLRDFRRKAPYYKTILQGRGCVLPFYDFLDSYADEFQRIVDHAKQEYGSLVDVHEVDEHIFDDSDRNWSNLGYGDFDQIFFEVGDEAPDYGSHSRDANLAGSMTAFLDAKQELQSVILIRRTVKTHVQHRELKYAFKIASLLHELGHVQDLEQGINFDVPAKRMDIIEAEVFANLFALEQMAQRNLLQSFHMLESGLRDAVSKGGYLTKVAEKVLEKLPEYEMKEWQDFLDDPFTEEEAKKIGPRGVEVIGQ